MPRNPKLQTISVVVITSDRPMLLNRCLLSLADQTVKPIEIIIVDGSKRHNETAVIANYCRWTHRLPICLLRDDRRSIPYARNLGALKSHGDIVVYLDDDLAAANTYLSRMQDHFIRDRKLTAVMGRIRNMLPGNVYASTYYAYYDRGLRHHFPSLRHEHRLTAGRMLDCEVVGIRRAVISRVKFYGPRPYRNEDVELGIRLIRMGKHILFDPSIIAVTWPRTTFLPLAWTCIRNGYWDAYVEKRFIVDLRASPHRTPFFTWWIGEVRSKKHYSVLKRVWYAALLLSWPVLARAGGLWYRITTNI